MYKFLEDFSKFKQGDVAKLPRALGGSLIARGIVVLARKPNESESNIDAPKKEWTKKR